MEVLSKSDLRQLVNNTSGPCVSLYLPTHRAGLKTQQDSIRLKNLLRKAESGLQASGWRGFEISQLLQPARKLVEDHDFWQHQSDGLAILTSPGIFRLYRLQLQVPELAVTSDRFHLKPLLAWIAASGHYYVLALSQNHVRVFQATREAIAELDSRDLPELLTRTLRERMPERRLQGHSVAAVLGGRRAILFHGHGDGDEDRKQVLLTYFQRVDEGMRDLLAQNRAPVVLAEQPFEQQAIVGFIGGAGAGEAGGEDARRAAERVHLQAGIVGEEQAGRVRSVVARLDDGIVRERGAVFHAGRNVAEAGQRFDRDPLARRQREFARLAGPGKLVAQPGHPAANAVEARKHGLAAGVEIIRMRIKGENLPQPIPQDQRV